MHIYKQVFYRERIKEHKSPISLILLFNSEIGVNYKHYINTVNIAIILVHLTPQQIISINSRLFRKEQELKITQNKTN